MIEVDGLACGPLRIAPGECVRLVGSNGSGKTTLLRALAGLPVHARPGRIRVNGQDPAMLAPPAIAARVRFLPADATQGLVGLTPTGEARMRGTNLPDTLRPLAHRPVAELSRGEARRVAWRIEQARWTPVLLLDEPLEELDAAGRADVARWLTEEKAKGTAVLVCDPSGMLASVADRTVAMDAVPATALAPLAPPGQGPKLSAPAASVQRGATRLSIPALSFGPGLHVVRGPNGSGKTTWLLQLAGLFGSDVCIDGTRVRPGDTVRMQPADNARLWSTATVADELVGLSPDACVLVPAHLHGRHPLTLSSGESQRLALAVALGTPAPLVLLDEPEAHLDSAGRVQLRDLLAARTGNGVCIVAATHDGVFAGLAHSVTEVVL